MRRLLLAGLLALAAVLARRLVASRSADALAEISNLDDETITGADGAVRSVQGADVLLPSAELERLWTPESLERLARTYWRYLTAFTLGIIRVKYTDRERFVCVLFRPFVLLSFQAPEYEMDGDRGIVRWRIQSGVLVSAQGRGGNGYLEIDVHRCDDAAPGKSRLHVEVEVANFYPAIASTIGRWVYENTQSRIHVFVTHGFLRSLARLELEESAVGRFDVRGDGTPAPREGEPPVNVGDTPWRAWAAIAAGVAMVASFLYLRFYPRR